MENKYTEEYLAQERILVCTQCGCLDLLISHYEDFQLFFDCVDCGQAYHIDTDGSFINTINEVEIDV